MPKTETTRVPYSGQSEPMADHVFDNLTKSLVGSGEQIPRRLHHFSLEFLVHKLAATKVEELLAASPYAVKPFLLGNTLYDHPKLSGYKTKHEIVAAAGSRAIIASTSTGGETVTDLSYLVEDFPLPQAQATKYAEDVIDDNQLQLIS